MKIIPKGTKINVHLDTGFAGSDEHINAITSRDFTEEELGNILQEMAYENAQSYGIEYGNMLTPEEIEEIEEAGGEVSYDICGDWDYYDEEAHSGYWHGANETFDEIY